MADRDPEEMLEGRVERLEAEVRALHAVQVACTQWEAEHDGRINAYWEQQFKTNGEIKLLTEKLSDRVMGVERKVMYISGFAAAIGGLIGGLAAKGLG